MKIGGGQMKEMMDPGIIGECRFVQGSQWWCQHENCETRVSLGRVFIHADGGVFVVDYSFSVFASGAVELSRRQ